jgi:hypothetical protein
LGVLTTFTHFIPLCATIRRAVPLVKKKMRGITHVTSLFSSIPRKGIRQGEQVGKSGIWVKA